MAQCHTVRPAKKGQCHLHLGSGTIDLQDAYCNESSMQECLLNSSKAAHQALRHMGSCSRPPSHYPAAPRPSLKAEMQQSWRSVCYSAAMVPRFVICAQERRRPRSPTPVRRAERKRSRSRTREPASPQYSETDSSSSSSSDDEPEVDPAAEAERLRCVFPARCYNTSHVLSFLCHEDAQGMEQNSGRLP